MNVSAEIVRKAVRLPARLPFGLRARRRGHRRHAHRTDPRRARADLHVRRCLRQGRPLRRAHPPSRPPDRAACCGSGRKAPGSSRRSAGTRRSTGSRKRFSRRSGARVRKRLAVFLRRHDGPRDARRDRAPDPRQALFPLLRHDLRRGRLAGLCRRNGTADRRRPARDGEVGLRRHLGNQRGRDPGQRDDPRGPRPQGARREDRRHRHLRDRDDAAGRPRPAPPARHGRRARLRRHACPLPRRPRRPRLSRALSPTRRPSSKRTSQTRDPAWAAAITGLDVAEIEAFAALVGQHQADLLPPRLWLLAPAQRRGQHARRALHPRRDRAPGRTRAAARSTATAASSSCARP